MREENLKSTVESCRRILAPLKFIPLLSNCTNSELLYPYHNITCLFYTFKNVKYIDIKWIFNNSPPDLHFRHLLTDSEPIPVFGNFIGGGWRDYWGVKRVTVLWSLRWITLILQDLQILRSVELWIKTQETSITGVELNVFLVHQHVGNLDSCFPVFTCFSKRDQPGYIRSSQKHLISLNISGMFFMIPPHVMLDSRNSTEGLLGARNVFLSAQFCSGPINFKNQINCSMFIILKW